MLHHGRGRTHIQQIDLTARQISQIASQIEQFQRIGVASYQDSQIQIAHRACHPSDATAKGIDRQQTGQTRPHGANQGIAHNR